MNDANDLTHPAPDMTGDPRIDREHQELMTCFFEFERVRRDRDGHDGAVKALHFLLHHVLTHFQSEEERMESVGYPDLPAHRAEHASLVNDVRGMVSLFHENFVSAEVVGRFLSERVLRHLQARDRRFAEWMQTR